MLKDIVVLTKAQFAFCKLQAEMDFLQVPVTAGYMTQGTLCLVRRTVRLPQVAPQVEVPLVLPRAETAIQSIRSDGVTVALFYVDGKKTVAQKVALCAQEAAQVAWFTVAVMVLLLYSLVVALLYVSGQKVAVCETLQAQRTFKLGS